MNTKITLIAFYLIIFIKNIPFFFVVSKKKVFLQPLKPPIRSKAIFNLFLILKVMYLDSQKKQEIFGKYGQSNSDTGSTESQVALFSYRIAHLTEHMKKNRKDHTTERSLVKLVGKRRALLKYLKNKDIERYRAIVKALGLRK